MAKRTWTVRTPRFQADRVCPLMPVWPWGGHRHFAYDLVRWMRPKQIAELGVHWGTSFFAFAQAVKDGRIPCALIGADTFEGDEHAGFYGEEVYQTVNGIIRRYFPKLDITIHCMFFASAAERVKDGSCDIIHIDGLHTYEAVQEDYETWLPKLAPEGVMLFHDVTPESGYGSADFWRDVNDAHPGFAFMHSWGLGVLFPKGDRRLRELRAQGLDDKIALYTHKADAELLAIRLRDAESMAEERMHGIEQQSRIIDERTRWIENLQADLAAANTIARDRLEALNRQGEEILANVRRISELEQRSRTHADEAARASERLSEVAARAEAIEREAETFRHRLKEADRMNHELSQRIEALAQRADAIEQTVERDRAENNRRHEDLGLALERNAREAAQAAEREREQTATRLRALGDESAAAHNELRALLADIGKRLDRSDVDAELMQLRAEHLERIVASLRLRIASLDRKEAWEDAEAPQRIGRAG